MMIEQNTNYAYKLKYMENPTFDKVRDLAIKFVRELPKQLQDELYEALNRGIDILDSEPQMVTYLYAFGPMHQAKLNYAFKHLPEEFLEQPEINIIDYGCGQALGTMCYADYLRENGYTQKVKVITLIEPSEMCLKRAVLHALVFFPDAEIKTINKKFDNLINEDIVCDEETPTLHILSNVLDMLTFDIDKFTNLVKGYLKGYNQFACVGPYFNYLDKDNRMKDFLSLMQGRENYFKPFDKFEFDKDKTWTAQILCFSVGELREKVVSTEVTDEDLKNSVMDVFGVVYSHDGKKLLKCENKEIITYKINEDTRVICDFAFNLCESLQQVSIPKSVISIGSLAFCECKSLQQVIIPNSVTNIGDYAFTGCESLQRVSIPKSVISIGNAAFFGCSSLLEMSIPDSVLNNRFWYEPSLQRITISDSVTCIRDEAFQSFKSLKHIIIPDSVTVIGKDAFRWCESLQEITIPNSVTRIGEGAFSICRSLKQIIIPDSITVIEKGTFEHCSSLQQAVFNSVTSIEEQAFGFCSSLQLISIPDSVTNIGDSTFIECESLRQVSIPKSVISIGKSAFFGCSSLMEISIPDSVTEVAENAFVGCRSLQRVTISNSVTEIGKNAFAGCRSLQIIDIPNSVTDIGQCAFCECRSLQNVTIPDTVDVIGFKTFMNCSSLQQIIIPNSVISIEEMAFFGCCSLQIVSLPNSITKIGEDSFDDTIQQIIIPKGSLERFKGILNQKLWDKLVECETL